jgi:hypothetical protein
MNNDEQKTENRPTCPPGDDLLAALRGELDPEAAEGIKAHVCGCDVCRKESDDLKAMLAHIVENAPETRPCDVLASVLREVRTEAGVAAAGSPEGKLRLISWQTAGLALAASLLVGMLYLRGEKPQTQTASPVVAGAGRMQAINGALQWLVAAQDKTGGGWDVVKWGGKKEYETSLAGMALLAILRSPAYGNDPELKESASGAARFLLNNQNEDGSFGPEGDCRMYNQGIATTALLSKHVRGDMVLNILMPLDKAVNYIVSKQNPNGGWAYSSEDGRQPNLSVTCWQIQSLVLAHNSRFRDVGPNLQRAVGWVTGIANRMGHFGYESPAEASATNQTLTAMGAFCIFHAGSRTPVLAANMERTRAELERVAKGAGAADFYRSYFLAAAITENYDMRYRPALEALDQALLARHLGAGPFKGTWTPEDQWGGVGGRLYSTIMATLSLERSNQAEGRTGARDGS